MSSSFSRSIRVLQETSGGRGSFWGILLLGGLLIIWLFWFITAPIPRYEVASSAKIISDDSATAVFPATSLHKIANGQPVLLSIDAFPKSKYGTITAVVSTIHPISIDGTIEIDLTLQSVPVGISLQEGLTGQSRINIGDASPISILFSTLQQKLMIDS